MNNTNKIQMGQIYIFPTDTAFGIGCRIDDIETTKKLFDIRKRPRDKAVPVLVASLSMAKKYGLLDSQAEDLAENFWPGGLTIIVKARKDKVPELVRGGGDTVGLRMPNHKDLLRVIKNSGVPILGPSANFAGQPTPYNQKDLDDRLLKMVDGVIQGNTKSKIASTVVDTTTTPWKVLREGAVSTMKLKKFLP